MEATLLAHAPQRPPTAHAPAWAGLWCEARGREGGRARALDPLDGASSGETIMDDAGPAPGAGATARSKAARRGAWRRLHAAARHRLAMLGDQRPCLRRESRLAQGRALGQRLTGGSPAGGGGGESLQRRAERRGSFWEHKEGGGARGHGKCVRPGARAAASGAKIWGRERQHGASGVGGGGDGGGEEEGRSEEEGAEEGRGEEGKGRRGKREKGRGRGEEGKREEGKREEGKRQEGEKGGRGRREKGRRGRADLR